MEDEVRHKIMNFIIDIDEPFGLEKIIYICKRHDIDDIEAIKSTLEFLCEADIIKYSEKEKGYIPCA